MSNKNTRTPLWSGVGVAADLDAQLKRAQAHIADLELAAREQLLLLNYLVHLGNGKYEMKKAAVTEMMGKQGGKLRGIKSVHQDNGDAHFLYADDSSEPKLIIVP